ESEAGEYGQRRQCALHERAQRTGEHRGGAADAERRRLGQPVPGPGCAIHATAQTWSGASVRKLPPASSSARSIVRARRRSWVTSTKLVPISRLSSSISA